MLLLERLKTKESSRLNPLSQSEIIQLWGGGSVFLFDKMGNVISVSENGYDYNEFKVGEKSFSTTNNIHYSTYSSTREIRDSDENLLGIESYSGTCFTGMDWDIFDFVSRNTDVEWGLSCNGKGHGSDGYMVTQHKTDEFIRDSNSLRNGYNTLFHNHPNNNGPSSEDEEAYHSLMNRINQAKYSYTRVGVYCPGSNETIFVK